MPTGTVEYSYDGFYRASYDINVGGNEILRTHYAFLDGTATDSTTSIPCFIENIGNNWNDMLSYTYDSKGNIETIIRNNLDDVKYYYDDLNQLVREDNWGLNKTIAYTYDSGGNIQSVNEYAFTEVSDLSTRTPTKSNTYTYGDANWKDKLTAYNGNTITYDQIGNPLTYYDGKTFTWQNGRQLASVSGNGLDVSYTYDANGIRTSKTINEVTTTYTLEGSNIVKETDGTNTIWYYYDASGSPVSFDLNGTPYFYVKNLQGDIIAITNASGTVVAEYTYDSWGKLISITGSGAGSVGAVNHFLYRGYYYDYELGLYYLNSRYYDPNIKRFINADGYAATGESSLECNMYVYCENSPVCSRDSSGTRSEDVISNNPWVGGYFLGYDSADAAVIAFSVKYQSASQYSRIEFGTAIYSREILGETRYFYSTPVAGYPHAISIDAILAVSRPKGSVVVAFAHTHPDSSRHSPEDIYISESNDLDVYVTNTMNDIYVHSPQNYRDPFVATIEPIGLSKAEKNHLKNKFQIIWDNHFVNGYCKHLCKKSDFPSKYW